MLISASRTGSRVDTATDTWAAWWLTTGKAPGVYSMDDVAKDLLDPLFRSPLA